MDKRLLVTGGAGFIGSNFIRHVLRTDAAAGVVNLDKLTYAGNPENLSDVQDDARYRFVQGDINDPALVRELMGDADVCVHFAAESHVDRSIMDATPFVLTNVHGTGVLLEAAREVGLERFVHVGTDEVYGPLPLDSPNRFDEDSPYRPRSPYAASKAGSDMLVRAYHQTHGLDVVLAVCSNNFGPYQFPEKVIPLFVTNLLEGRKVPLYGDGLHVRDWLHVEDCCEAIVAVMQRGRSGEAYNIGGNNECSNLDLTHAILDALEMDASMIEHVKDRPGHDRRYALNTGKAEHELGWQPTRSAFPEAIAQTVAWYRENAAWWQRIRSGDYQQYYRDQYDA